MMLSQLMRVRVRVISQSNKSAGYESEVYTVSGLQVGELRAMFEGELQIVRDDAYAIDDGRILSFFAAQRPLTTPVSISQLYMLWKPDKNLVPRSIRHFKKRIPLKSQLTVSI